MAAEQTPPRRLLSGHPEWERLLSLYDTPAGPGYDRDHALRTMLVATRLARHLGCPEITISDFTHVCLLHDLSRVGLERTLFARIFSLAAEHGIPTRPRELRQQFPAVAPGQESEAFQALIAPHLAQAGLAPSRLPLPTAVTDQIEIRLAAKRRLGQVIERVQPALTRWSVELRPWMVQLILYYYYPEELAAAPDPLRRLGRVLVAAEQFEAQNNRERGRDYYGRGRETLAAAFAHMEILRGQGLISAAEIAGLRELTAAGELNDVLREARGLSPTAALPPEDRAYLARPSASAVRPRPR